MAPGKRDQQDVEPAEPEAMTQPFIELLRLPAGPVDIGSLDTRGTPGFPGTKADAPALTEALGPELGDLQERLFASGRASEADAKKVLVILQGMDTSGKGGVIRHAIGMVDPQGVTIKAFKAPTEQVEETPLSLADRARAATAGHDRHLRPFRITRTSWWSRVAQLFEESIGTQARRDQRLRARLSTG